MKVNWLPQAIIRIPDLDALNKFIEYCDERNILWDNIFHIRNAKKFIKPYMEQHSGEVCINVEPDGRMGYCYADYYKDDIYYQNDDPQWNFCSVEFFIEATDGLCFEELHDFDFDAIL